MLAVERPKGLSCGACNECCVVDVVNCKAQSCELVLWKNYFPWQDQRRRGERKGCDRFAPAPFETAYVIIVHHSTCRNIY
jgi:hypothetical protein